MGVQSEVSAASNFTSSTERGAREKDAEKSEPSAALQFGEKGEFFSLAASSASSIIRRNAILNDTSARVAFEEKKKKKKKKKRHKTTSSAANTCHRDSCVVAREKEARGISMDDRFH